MAKTSRNNNTRYLQTKDGNKGLQLSTTEHIDDTPIPSPEDLAKYNSIDSSIVPWLMQTSEKEQQFRHNREARKLDILEDVNKKVYSSEMTRIYLSFVIVILFLGASVALIFTDKVVIGSIFTGVTLIAVIYAFIGNKKDKEIVNKE